MKRILPRSVYLSVVGFVIVTMSVNPASGGWLLHKMRCGSHGRHGAGHCQVTIPCQPVCCETPVYVDPCCGAAMGSVPMMVQSEWPMAGAGCCGSDTVYGGEIIQGGEIIYDGEVIPEGTATGDDQVMEAPETSTPPAPAAGSETSEPETSVESNESSSSDVAAPQTPAESRTPEAAAPKPAAPKPAAPAAPTTPAPAAPSPAPAPATTAPDNLFDEPAAPAPQPAAPAAEPAADDIFGEAPAATPAPAPAAPAPAAQPADDLFGEPAPAAPAEAPMDDLFGEPAAPAAAPAETAPADDIFGTPPAAEPAAPAAEPAAPAAEPAKDSLDDLFGSSATPDALANSQVRVWIDNTGEFSTEGRLIEVGSDFIRLLKTNGRTCTVPHSRLCTADVAYVAAIAVDTNDVKVAMAGR